MERTKNGRITLVILIVLAILGLASLASPALAANPANPRCSDPVNQTPLPGKACVLHTPPNNPVWIEIPCAALPAHIAHGDTVGVTNCDPPTNCDVEVTCTEAWSQMAHDTTGYTLRLEWRPYAGTPWQTLSETGYHPVTWYAHLNVPQGTPAGQLRAGVYLNGTLAHAATTNCP